MSILKHLDKNNLHHAYLIEGARDLIVPEIIKFCEGINIKTSGNPDFVHITIDNLKMDEALDLRALSANRGFSSAKKIFLLCVNTFSLDAEGVLLKMFEEPIENTHFFLVVPDTNALLKTLVSRFYLIRDKAPTPEGVGVPTESVGNAEKFINMPKRDRIDFIKDLLVEIEGENVPMPKGIGIPTESVGKDLSLDSNRSKSLKFLNALEFVLHNKAMSRSNLDMGVEFFDHFFKVRKFLRMPGSSTKSLMESVALIIPKKI